MFDEGGSTDVELPFAYYIFHGRGSGRGGGAALPSHTEHRRQKKYNPKGNNFFFSLSLRMGGLNSALPHDVYKNCEQ